MRIFFLSNQNSCRSQMAEAILRSFDKNLEIYSAGVQPLDHVSPTAIKVLKDIGIELKQNVPKHYSEFIDMEFDYLITVGDGTIEEIKIPPIKYKRKMHLGFHNPYNDIRNHDELRKNCEEIRDEIQSELAYFFYRVMEKGVAS